MPTLRAREYTDRGLARCKCLRCGKPATDQWSACAVGNKWMPLCTDCDIGLNRVALEYIMGPRKARLYLDIYETRRRA